MKKLFLACLSFTMAQAMEYEIQFDNEQVAVSRIVLAPKEELGLHRDHLPQIVIALKGGTITRIEADGREVDIEFPTGKAVYRPIDPEGEYHKSVNNSEEPIEAIIVQLKKP